MKNSNLIQLTVFYRNLQFTSITQEAKTKLDSLVSNIGGIVEFNFINLIELLELISELCYNVALKHNTPKITDMTVSK